MTPFTDVCRDGLTHAPNRPLTTKFLRLINALTPVAAEAHPSRCQAMRSGARMGLDRKVAARVQDRTAPQRTAWQVRRGHVMLSYRVF